MRTAKQMDDTLTYVQMEMIDVIEAMKKGTITNDKANTLIKAGMVMTRSLAVQVILAKMQSELGPKTRLQIK